MGGVDVGLQRNVRVVNNLDSKMLQQVKGNHVS